MGKRMSEVPWEPGYCLWNLEASSKLSTYPPTSQHTLLPVNHPGTLSACGTILSTGCLSEGTALPRLQAQDFR